MIAGHSYRTWMFGLALAALDRAEIDRELFYCAALLHDYGIAEPTPGRDFTLGGADRLLACADRPGPPPAGARRWRTRSVCTRRPGSAPTATARSAVTCSGGRWSTSPACASGTSRPPTPRRSSAAIRAKPPSSGGSPRRSAPRRGPCRAAASTSSPAAAFRSRPPGTLRAVSSPPVVSLRRFEPGDAAAVHRWFNNPQATEDPGRAAPELLARGGGGLGRAGDGRLRRGPQVRDRRRGPRRAGRLHRPLRALARGGPGAGRADRRRTAAQRSRQAGRGADDRQGLRRVRRPPRLRRDPGLQRSREADGRRPRLALRGNPARATASATASPSTSRSGPSSPTTSAAAAADLLA